MKLTPELLYYVVYAKKYFNLLKKYPLSMDRCRRCPYYKSNNMGCHYIMKLKFHLQGVNICNTGKLKSFLENALKELQELNK